jgi:hypothetical protein
VLRSVKIPKEQSPFAGLEATRVWLKREAEVEYTRTVSIWQPGLRSILRADDDGIPDPD